MIRCWVDWSLIGGQSPLPFPSRLNNDRTHPLWYLFVFIHQTLSRESTVRALELLAHYFEGHAKCGDRETGARWAGERRGDESAERSVLYGLSGGSFLYYVYAG